MLAPPPPSARGGHELGEPAPRGGWPGTGRDGPGRGSGRCFGLLRPLLSSPLLSSAARATLARVLRQEAQWTRSPARSPGGLLTRRDSLGPAGRAAGGHGRRLALSRSAAPASLEPGGAACSLSPPPSLPPSFLPSSAAAVRWAAGFASRQRRRSEARRRERRGGGGPGALLLLRWAWRARPRLLLLSPPPLLLLLVAAAAAAAAARGRPGRPGLGRPGAPGAPNTGIWRIPVDEIDRPGSFASHMNRSIVLLLDVLSQLKDYHTLLKVSSMLQRTPDQGKKYLRDADRQVLAQRAFVLTVTVLEDMLIELTKVSEDPDAKYCILSGTRMTTDVSNKASAEEGQDALPKKAALSDVGVAAAAYGAENGVKDVAPGQPPPALDAVELEAKAAKEISRPGSTEPMDLDGYANDLEKTDTSSKCPESVRALPGRISKDKPSESRTAELSLEELSISSKHQQLEGVKVRVQAGPTEEVSQRPSRKRKLIDDAESGKTLLLDAYRVWQHGQKVMTYDLGKIEKIMSETYMLIKQVDEEAALEQAVRFCQVHIGASAQKQSTGEMPTTPKHTRDAKECFFPAAPSSLNPPSVAADAVASEVLLRLSDLHSKPKSASPPPSSSSSSAGVLLLLPPPPPQAQAGAELMEEAPAVSGLAREEEDEGKLDRPLEGLSFQQQESHLCQQMKMATVATSSNPARWQVELESVTSPSPGQACSQASSSKTELGVDLQPVGSQQNKADSSRMKPRVLPSMPKLFIPSSITKFPPEITVTPPTPTLLSPKGSISEETKQKLKSAILSAQSAANVKKESLCQPALEIVETSSQESSLESDTDEEEDCMDV